MLLPRLLPNIALPATVKRSVSLVENFLFYGTGRNGSTAKRETGRSANCSRLSLYANGRGIYSNDSRGERDALLCFASRHEHHPAIICSWSVKRIVPRPGSVIEDIALPAQRESHRYSCRERTRKRYSNQRKHRHEECDRISKKLRSGNFPGKIDRGSDSLSAHGKWSA